MAYYLVEGVGGRNSDGVWGCGVCGGGALGFQTGGRRGDPELSSVHNEAKKGKETQRSRHQGREEHLAKPNQQADLHKMGFPSFQLRMLRQQNPILKWCVELDFLLYYQTRLNLIYLLSTL